MLLPIVIMPRFDRLSGPLALLRRLANDRLLEIAVAQTPFSSKLVVRAALADPADETAVHAFLTPGFLAALVAIDDS